MKPDLWLVFPFVLLLLLIALGPVRFPTLWGRWYPAFALGLGTSVVAWYVFQLNAGHRVLEVSGDYLRFMALIGSLYVVSGGIHLTVKGEATPGMNVAFLLGGGLLANLVGTTGASMLLIRPWIRMNKYRVTTHHIVFFIFIVSNVGGCLTPIGDPPLYLGYLKGIPFGWISQHVWPIWATGLGILLGMFYLVDLKNYRRAPISVREKLAEPADTWKFTGLFNLALLAVILGAAFLERPAFLREAILFGAALTSYLVTPKAIHESNQFNLHPIREVAILFAGIFATMMPALDWLQSGALGSAKPSPTFLFAGSGILSSVLDNAPTYLAFLSATLGSVHDPALLDSFQQVVLNHGTTLPALSAAHAEPIQRAWNFLQQYQSAAITSGSISRECLEVSLLLSSPEGLKFVLAISVGSVFFGANTYIGNGPNFMVKAIADQQHVHTPSFGGYILRFTLPFMIPMLCIVWACFFRHG